MKYRHRDRTRESPRLLSSTFGPAPHFARSMQILLLGGTGPVGIHFLRQALERDHTVIVYARSPDKVPLDLREHASVKIFKGSLEDDNLIRQAFSVECGIDAVVSALGPPVTGLHPKDAPIARAYERVIKVMKEKGVKRILVLGTASITDELDSFNLKFKAMVTTYARPSFVMSQHAISQHY